MRRWMTMACLAALLAQACDGARVPGDGGPAADGAAPLDASATCGDGALDPGEGCDDGNAVTGDGCSAGCRVEHGAGLADEVVEAPGATGTGFGDPTKATNGVRGGGETTQSLDVYSIRPGSHLVLGFGGRRLVDGPGADLVVFENAFRYGDGRTFMDPTVVEVSADGETWHAFAHDYVADDEAVYSPREEDWVGFAGVTPVRLHVDDDDVDPFDAQAAGGDAFDLATLPGLPAEGVRYVRLSPATDHVNPDTGAPFVADPVSDGPDIDGVIARYLLEAP